jgi:hypothetical protein
VRIRLCRSATVAWGWRAGDVQLGSPEDRRRVLLLNRAAREQRALVRSIQTLRRMGLSGAEMQRRLARAARHTSWNLRLINATVAEALERADLEARREHGIRW